MIKPKHLLADFLFLASLSTTSALLQTPRVYADFFNMMGEWSGSPDCPITFYKDDGKYVEGNCDNGSFNHTFLGSYSNPNEISLTLTRIDPAHCQTSVPASLHVIDSNHLKYWQGGWDGCGIRTKPLQQDWYRVNVYPEDHPFPPPQPSPTISPPSPEPSPPTGVIEKEDKSCLIKIGQFCLFQ